MNIIFQYIILYYILKGMKKILYIYYKYKLIVLWITL